MACYNFLKNITRFSLYSLFIIAFVVVCLLLMSTSSHAFVYDDTVNDLDYYVNDTFYNHIKESDYYNDNYMYFTWAFSYNSDIIWSVICVPSNSYDYIADINTTTNEITWNPNITDFYQSVSNPENDFPYIKPIVLSGGNIMNKNWYHQSSVKNITIDTVGASLCRFFFGSPGSVILNGNSNTDPNFPSIDINMNLIFENYDKPHVKDKLTNGEFSYFYFRVKKKGERLPYPCGIYFHDVTNFDIPFNTYVNDSTSFFIDLNEYAGDYTGPNYLFKYYEDTYYIYYSVPCSIFSGSYNNHSTYKLTLFYIDTDNNDTRYERNYMWTTNFSAAGITKQEENRNDQMLSNLNSLREFFDKNTQLSNASNILRMFPSSSNYSAPTDNGINTIFNSFYNAFTNTNTTTFSFEVPFSDGQIIDIPSDIITEKIPSSILFIIQTVYWFFICRFIVKDIAGIAQKAKSGEILNDNAGNIKTDLL